MRGWDRWRWEVITSEAANFSRCDQVNMCLGEWRQDVQMVIVGGNTSEGGGTHEYDDWEVVGGG
jgi:hypothetical protein